MEFVENRGDEISQIRERITYLFNNDLLSDVGLILYDRHAAKSMLREPRWRFCFLRHVLWRNGREVGHY